MRRRRAARLAPLALAAALLTGCYLPVRFDAEIEITRFGTYDMIFDGYMASVPLYQGLRQGKISEAEEREKVARIETDLNRDSATKSFAYIRQGIFKVHWRKAGDLLKTRMVTFPRRNQAILSLKFIRKTGLITMDAASFSRRDKERLAAIGLGMEGQIRVRTDAKVVGHNTTRVTAGPRRVYVWDIKSIFDAPPKLTIALK